MLSISPVEKDATKGEGGGSQATTQKALMQRTVGSLPNLTFSTGGLQLHPNRLYYRLPMGITTK